MFSNTVDGSLSCNLYVGRPDDVQAVQHLLGDEELALQLLKRLGKNYGKDLGIIVLSTLVGGILGSIGRVGKIAKGLYFLGKIGRAGGTLYGLGDMVRNTYNELVPAGVCTLVIAPAKKEFTSEQVNKYRQLAGQFEKYKTLGEKK